MTNDSTGTKATAPPPSNLIRSCPCCGATDDLAPESRYLGGHGYVTDLVCRSRTDCWNRVWEQRQRDFVERDADCERRAAAAREGSAA